MVADSNHYCPICGVKFTDEGAAPWHHRCADDVLDALDRRDAEIADDDEIVTLDGYAVLVGDLGDLAELEERGGGIRRKF